jgi:hypothetical protein
MNEPGLADVQDLQLLVYPAGFDSVHFNAPVTTQIQHVGRGENVKLQSNQIAVFVDDPSGLEII